MAQARFSSFLIASLLALGTCTGSRETDGEATFRPAVEASPGQAAQPTAPETIASPTRRGPQPRTIGDGTHRVGTDVRPGTYRTREPADFCYWARLRGFGGTVDDIIANENVVGYGVVTIGPRDKGFESNGCPEWTSDLSRVTASRTSFGDGTFIVRTDILAGTYRSSGGEFCYWARLRSFGGTVDDIIANGNASGRVIISIRSTDKGFQSHGCGTFRRG
jgi:hypothetical protein